MNSFLRSGWFKTALVACTLVLARPSWGVLNIYSDDLNHNGTPNESDVDRIIPGSAEDNSDGIAQDNIDKIVDAMVEIYKNGGGTLYFKPSASAYKIWRPIYPLPGVNISGTTTNGADACIKNVTTDGDYWLAPVLYGGYAAPDEGYQTSTDSLRITWRAFYNGVWPTIGGTSVRVATQADYDATSIGDEIQVMSGSNAVNSGNGSVIPDYMFKAIVTGKHTVTNPPVRYWLDLTCYTPAHDSYGAGTIPFTLSSVAAAECKKQWGSVTAGQPAWFLTKDYYSVSNPIYYAASGRHGYAAYLALGAWEGTGNRWVRGWTSHNNQFSYITFWSKYGNVMYRALPCSSSFDHCLFKGAAPIYGNSLQNTTFTNCQGYFWDVAAEIAYNSLFSTMTNCSFTYDSSLNYGAGTPNANIGIFAVHERSYGMTFTGTGAGLTINVGSRTVSSNNSLVQITGEQHNFTKIAASVPQYSAALFSVDKDLDDNNPTTDITLSNVVVNMNSNYFNNFCALKEASSYVTFQSVSFTNPNTATASKNQIILGGGGDNTANHCYFYNVDMPSPGASNVGALNLGADFTGQEIHVKQDCTLKGITGANVANGIIGTNPGAITIDP